MFLIKIAKIIITSAVIHLILCFLFMGFDWLTFEDVSSKVQRSTSVFMFSFGCFLYLYPLTKLYESAIYRRENRFPLIPFPQIDDKNSEVEQVSLEKLVRIAQRERAESNVCDCESCKTIRKEIASGTYKD